MELRFSFPMNLCFGDKMISNIQNTPLAERMRPENLDEFLGQEHIVGKDLLLRRAIQSGMLGSCIFFGPPGTGKTTLARIIAKSLNGEFRSLNAVSSGVADAKKVIEEAKKNTAMFGTKTYLLLDECHRWSKAQSDCVLSAIEDGTIVFIGSTTENPYTSMTRAIVSRCRVFEFKSLESEDVKIALKRAIKEEDRGFGKLPLVVSDEAINHFAWSASGDVRSALNSLELAVKTTNMNNDGKIIVDILVAEQSTQKKAMSLSEDQFYDILSAFCKSIRGSDSDAALYYMQRMLLAGVDPMIIARRLIAHCSEDIGMADSNALLLATSALISVKNLGVPECILPLSHAIIYACEAEKSNSVYVAMNKAREDVENKKDDSIPFHLLNHSSILDEKKSKYKYPHNYGGYVEQQYLPDSLKDNIYYIPTSNGREKNIQRKKMTKRKK